MNLQQTLDGLKKLDIEQCDQNTLVDLKSVTINKSLPVPERIASFIKQVKNPYLFKVNDITVKVEFSSGKSLEYSLFSFLMSEQSR